MPRDRIGAPPSRDRIGSLAEGLGFGGFDVLVDIVLHHGFHFEDENLKKQFVTTANEIIELMFHHVQIEDARLYPFLRSQGVSLTPIL